MRNQQNHSHLNTDSPATVLEECFVSSCARLTSTLALARLFFFVCVFVPSVKQIATLTEEGSCKIRTRQILEVATLCHTPNCDPCHVQKNACNVMFTKECIYFNSKIPFTSTIYCCDDSGTTDLILQASIDGS